VYTSDNGPWLQYGIDGGSAGPLRDGKGTTWDGGERVPGIFRWPGRIPAGRRTDAVAGNLDLLPTLAQLAGAALPKDRVLDGLSLWPLLAGETNRSPHDYFHFLNGSAPGAVNYRGIRDARWKLVVDVSQDGKVNGQELYDLGADVSEKFNRMKDHPDIAQRLETAAQQFYEELSKHIRPAGKKSTR
jgi:arylsulfatase A-like enzyme